MHKNQRAAPSFKFKYNFGPSILGNNAGLSVFLFFHYLNSKICILYSEDLKPLAS